MVTSSVITWPTDGLGTLLFIINELLLRSPDPVRAIWKDLVYIDPKSARMHSRRWIHSLCVNDPAEVLKTAVHSRQQQHQGEKTSCLHYEAQCLDAKRHVEVYENVLCFQNKSKKSSLAPRQGSWNNFLLLVFQVWWKSFSTTLQLTEQQHFCYKITLKSSYNTNNKDNTEHLNLCGDPGWLGGHRGASSPSESRPCCGRPRAWKHPPGRDGNFTD